MIIDVIKEKLFNLQDKKYRDFQSKLIPNIDSNTIIGVRTPELRKLAKELKKSEEISLFLNNLPHQYFDENQLHAFILNERKDYDNCIKEVNAFLPYVNNWATCDQLSPKIFKKNKKDLLKWINEWISNSHTYTIRFSIGMLMQHFLDDDFDIKLPKIISRIQSDEYYINMMIAWYFATALAKQYDLILPFIENQKLNPWTHNKTIQKAIESYRISPEQKIYLKSLKIKSSPQNN